MVTHNIYMSIAIRDKAAQVAATANGGDVPGHPEAKALISLRTILVSLYLDSTVPSPSQVRNLFRSAMDTLLRSGPSMKKKSVLDLRGFVPEVV